MKTQGIQCTKLFRQGASFVMKIIIINVWQFKFTSNFFEDKGTIMLQTLLKNA